MRSPILYRHHLEVMRSYSQYVKSPYGYIPDHLVKIETSRFGDCVFVGPFVESGGIVAVGVVD